MKMVEIKLRSNYAELEKLGQKLERAERKVAKKYEAALKAGVAGWSLKFWREWIDRVEKTENGWIVNQADVKKNGAFNDLWDARRDLEEIKEEIQKAEARTAKAEAEVEAYHAELEKIEDLKRKEELFKLEFEAEQKEWAKDGIKLTSRYTGFTPKGKWFCIDRNQGWTTRSLHCFTLTICDEQARPQTIFTSGEFWRAYAVVKNS